MEYLYKSFFFNYISMANVDKSNISLLEVKAIEFYRIQAKVCHLFLPEMFIQKCMSHKIIITFFSENIYWCLMVNADKSM